MIETYFDEDGRPWVKASLTIPRLDIIRRRVDFLVDTGADSSSLNPVDGTRIGCPFDALVNPVDASGIGGSHTYYVEPAILALQEDAAAFTFDVEIAISKPHPVADEVPSLLGRDVLNQVRMDYNFPAGRLDLLAS